MKRRRNSIDRLTINVRTERKKERKRNNTRDRHTQTNTQSESKFNTRTSSGVDGRYYDNFVSFTFHVCLCVRDDVFHTILYDFVEKVHVSLIVANAVQNVCCREERRFVSCANDSHFIFIKTTKIPFAR